jgi:hypothetical protein
MARLTVKLPDLNGEVIAGISVLADKALAKKEFLEIPEIKISGKEEEDKAARKEAAFIAAANVLKSLGNVDKDSIQGHTVVAAYVVSAFGGACYFKHRNAPNAAEKLDGNWTLAGLTTINDADVQSAIDMIDDSKVAAVSTMIIATKLNFWLTNHHTGAGGMDAYPRKVFNAVFNREPTGIDITEVHKWGHWFSTHYSMHILGIATGVDFAHRYRVDDTYVITLADDMKIRQSSLPAGQAKHYIVYETFKKFCRHKGWLLLTGEQAAAITIASNEVRALLREVADEDDKASRLGLDVFQRDQDPRVRYHCGSSYLGNTKAESFSSAEQTGLIGSFLNNFMPSCTLAKSPMIKKNEGKELVYQNSESYDHVYEERMKNMARSDQMHDLGVKAISGVATTAGFMSDQSVENLFASVGKSKDDAGESLNILHHGIKVVNEAKAGAGARGSQRMIFPEAAKASEGEEDDDAVDPHSLTFADKKQ